MRTQWRRGAVLALSTVLLTGIVGCEGLLEITDPDIVTPAGLTGPTGLATLRAGAIGDFAFAYAGNGGGTEGQALVSGMFTDEYFHSGTFTTRREYDRRDVEDDNGTATGVFGDLHRARQSLETAAAAIAATGTDSRVGELLAMAGFTYVMFGENYCSGVPYSNLDASGNLVPGNPTTTNETFQLAVDQFNAAVTAANGDADFINLASVGLGRALLNMGMYDAAAAAVASVPTSFVFELTYSIANGQENGIYAFNAVFERWSLSDNEGVNGIAWRTLNDPRVPFGQDTPGDVGFDDVTPQWNMLKFPARDAPADLATGEEARLIEAEAFLFNSDIPNFLAAIDEVRDLYSLGGVADPGTAAGRVDLLFQERALTLFGTSHRLGDLRRLVRQYGRAATDVFPVGPYHKPAFPDYGTDVNLPIPFDEENNPNSDGCLDRNA